MEKINLIHSNYKKWLWSSEPNSDSFFIGFIRGLLQIISALLCDLKQGQLSLRAMSLVYTTIISIVPLFAISFSVLKGLGAHNQIRPFLLNALEPLGDKKVEITNNIISFVDNIQVSVLGALGIVVLLYTVIGMMQKMEYSFNYVWHISKPRNLAKRFNDYLSVLFVGPLLIFLSTAMTTSAKSNYLVEKLGDIVGVNMLLTLMGIIIPYLILTLAFTFLYSFVPNTKVKWGAAFIGGLMTAFIWKIMGWGFASFVANSSNQTAIYSAFATIIMFMIWIYMVWLVLLVGASISFYVQHPKYRKTRPESLNTPPAQKEAIAIEMMLEIATRFYNHNLPADSVALTEACKMSQNIIEETSIYLKNSGLITNEDGSNAFIPARPLENISYYDIITAVRTHSQQENNIYLSNSVNKYINNLDAVLKKEFQEVNLQQVVSSEKP